MVKNFIKKLIVSNRDFILHEMLEVKGLMGMIMKHRNTGGKWTSEEKKEIKAHLKGISRAVPALIIFLLPGGAFLLPLLAETLDRRGGERA